MASAQSNFQNKIFIQMEKDNAWQMFGYRMKYNRNVKVPDYEKTYKQRTDIG